ncbi:hypothetical protein [Streptomyces sp. NPDC018036]|uniref:hypothetical protein n=1 Tax=Streptomyces sp. NPDC018036 TaxID=3365035 RepID=UPI003797A98F
MAALTAGQDGDRVRTVRKNGADTVLGVQAGRIATPSRCAAYDLDDVARQLQEVAILADDILVPEVGVA